MIPSFTNKKRLAMYAPVCSQAMHTELQRPSFFPHTHTLWLCLAFCLPSTDSLSYSWPICLGKCCIRCVSKRTSSVSAVQLLIVSSSACQKCYYCPSNTPKDTSFSLLSIVAYLNPQFNLVLASLFKNGPSDSPMF